MIELFYNRIDEQRGDEKQTTFFVRRKLLSRSQIGQYSKTKSQGELPSVPIIIALDLFFSEEEMTALLRYKIEHAKRISEKHVEQALDYIKLGQPMIDLLLEKKVKQRHYQVLAEVGGG